MSANPMLTDAKRLECLSGRHPVSIEFVGVHDDVGQSGKPEELIEHYGMGRDAILAAARRVMAR